MRLSCALLREVDGVLALLICAFGSVVIVQSRLGLCVVRDVAPQAVEFEIYFPVL